MKVASIIILLTINLNIAFGCSCNEHKKFDIWDYLDYTLIVKGVILSIEEFPDSVQIDSTRNDYFKTGGYQLIKFKIEEVYKGNYSEIMIFKANLSNGLNCTKTFNIGENWYFFSSIENGENFIGGCSWSQKVDSNPKQIVKVITYIKELSVLQSEVVDKKYFDKDCSKKRSAKGLIINGQAEGYWIFSDKKGNPYMTGYYLNGVPDSLWIDYYRNEKEFATKNVAAKTYFRSNVKASIHYSFEGEIISGYCNSITEIPSELFSNEEIVYLKTKANSTYAQ